MDRKWIQGMSGDLVDLGLYFLGRNFKFHFCGIILYTIGLEDRASVKERFCIKETQWAWVNYPNWIQRMCCTEKAWEEGKPCLDENIKSKRNVSKTNYKASGHRVTQEHQLRMSCQSVAKCALLAPENLLKKHRLQVPRIRIRTSSCLCPGSHLLPCSSFLLYSPPKMFWRERGLVSAESASGSTGSWCSLNWVRH